MVDPTADPIELVPSRHEAWRRAFETERERVGDALAERGLAGTVERIDHVGSTAVPGLPAKDVVDLDVVVADDVVAAVAEAIAAALGGDRYRNAPEWHPVFRRAAGQRFNDHVFARSGEGWRVSVATREALRADADLRRAYAERKRELASETDDLTEYSRGKTDLVRRAVAAVRSPGGPSVEFRVPPPERVGPEG